MTGFRGLAVPVLLSALVTTSAAAAPAAESTARGRAIFDQKGCQHCHSYVARRAGPSVRELMRDFIGEPVKTAKGINAVREHQDDLRSGTISKSDLRLISEWLASDFWPDDEADDTAETPVAAGASAAPGVPAAKAATALPAVTPAAVPPALQKPAVPLAALPPAAPVAALSGPAVKAIRLQKEKGGVDRLLIELVGEPDEIDLQTVNGQLVVKFSGTQLANSAPRSLTAGESAAVVGAVRASSEQRSVELTVVPRVANWTYTAVQGRARLTIDLTAAASQPKALAAAGKPAAKAAVEGKAAKSDKAAAVTAKAKTAAAAAVAKAPTAAAPATATAAAAAAIAAGATAAIKPEAKAPVAVARAEPDAATLARREAEAARARQEAAKAKAAEEAATQATLKREAEARAKREAEAQAKAKRDAEVLASTPTKRDVAADATWPAAEGQSAGKTVRKGSKKPYKEPKLDPCPPASPADQVIGVVDVEQAKEIIDRIGCPQCHAYVQKKTGPPFKEVLKKYSGDPACVIHRLKTNETHKDEGVTKDIRPHEFKILADYVATRMKKD